MSFSHTHIFVFVCLSFFYLNHLLIYERVQVRFFELELLEVRTHPVRDPLVLEIRRVDQFVEHF